MNIKRLSRVVTGQRGFTVVEALISLSILLISITGTLSLFTIGFKNLAMPQNMTAATNIARAKVEEIKDTSFELITTYFPEGTYPIESTLIPEGATLSISYPDGVEANPLALSVTVSWEEDEQQRTIQLVTLVTSQ
jgi:Tfp pilus assembly protein PilV